MNGTSNKRLRELPAELLDSPSEIALAEVMRGRALFLFVVPVSHRMDSLQGVPNITLRRGPGRPFLIVCAPPKINTDRRLLLMN